MVMVVLDQIRHAQLVEVLLPPGLLTLLRGLSPVVPLTARVAQPVDEDVGKFIVHNRKKEILIFYIFIVVRTYEVAPSGPLRHCTVDDVPHWPHTRPVVRLARL